MRGLALTSAAEYGMSFSPSLSFGDPRRAVGTIVAADPPLRPTDADREKTMSNSLLCRSSRSPQRYRVDFSLVARRTQEKPCGKSVRKILTPEKAKRRPSAKRAASQGLSGRGESAWTNEG